MNIIKSNRIIMKLIFWLKSLSRRISPRTEINIFGLKRDGANDCIRLVYVINLTRQKKRWEQFAKEARIQKISGKRNLFDFCERVAAVDGSAIKTDDVISSDIDKTYNLKEQFYVDPDPRLIHIVNNNIVISMTPEEIAVAQSHLKAWNKMVNENISYALILEDDVFFENNFAEQANLVWQELPQQREDGYRFDILYLSYREVDRGAEKNIHSINLFRPVRGLWWLSGYVLSYGGAIKLLNALPIRGPVDLWINHQFNKLDVFATSISIISQRLDWKSDNKYSILPVLSQVGIQSDKSLLLLERKVGSKPIFAISSDDAERASLQIALSLLGYRCCNLVSDEFFEDTARLIDNAQPLPFDAYIDVAGIVSRYKQLEVQYPEAVFILTARNLNAVDNTVEAISDMSAKIAERRKHHGAFLNYFSNRPEKLLIINGSNVEGWDRLCNFLGCDVPDVAFPNMDPFPKMDKLNINVSGQVPIKVADCDLLEHDVHPWIMPAAKLSNFGQTEITRYGTRTGSFTRCYSDNFEYINAAYWKILENTFPSNLARFQSENLSLLDEGGIRMILRKQKSGNRDYTSASIASNAKYRYGRFEVELKPAKAEGVLTAFFLHRNDPWQEIDLEFLGKDTSRILVNVYYNPGEEGTNYNYGNRGTPVLINLGFDAADNFHRYAIEWESDEIRWFVDDELVHVRGTWEPTPIPDLPMQFHINTWPSRSEDLAGRLNSQQLPINSDIRSFVLSAWMSPNLSCNDHYDYSNNMSVHIDSPKSGA
ncbi:MAG: glycoside hydrolase family protein [Nitrospirae bacterium]|nr:MAG: glycoside hydrolase family protein [Nitrospirota bacterium]